MNADGTNQTRLTNNQATDASPSFSPDGTKIAFYSNRDPDGGGIGEIYVMNVDGTNQTRITNNTVNDGQPSWGVAASPTPTPAPTHTAVTPTGNNVSVQTPSGNGAATFSQVTSPGTTTFTPISPSSAGTPPAGFTILSTATAYDITTTTAYTPPVTVCFTVNSITSEADFARVRILHGEKGALVDRTILAPDAPAPDFATRRVCARVNSLSPFVVALAPAATPTPATLSLSQADYIVGEGAVFVAINVVRSGDISQAATISYTTSDTSGLNDCSNATGLASARCDYTVSVGTLSFAAGEQSKTVIVSIVDDSYSEGTETLTFSLNNPTGATLGTASLATVTITDNDAANGVNPVNGVDFFIRQHYLDILSREPEPAGFAGWQNVLNNCGTSVSQPCDRIEVSSGFFRSEEFQTRGYFIYRFYSAVGKIPLYEGFMPDFAKVSGYLSAQQLEENKVAFVNEFMTRQDFQTRYGALTDPTAYVDALLQTIGLPNHPQRNVWIASLTNNSLTRGQVLRSLVESGEVYSKYYTEAFVIMQYFGFLRRSADISYLQWIQTMNQTGGDYRIMINGFLNSAEYRKRFGP